MRDGNMNAAKKSAAAAPVMAEVRNRLIDFEDVTLRIRDRRILQGTDWCIKRDENWAVLGPNGSGKSTLLRALTGETPVVGGRIRRYDPGVQPDAIGFVSFELQQQIIAREQARDDARHFSGKLDSYLTVEAFISELRRPAVRSSPLDLQLLSALGVEALMSRPVQKLSTGEMRKLLIVKAVMKSRCLLILDEPFAGLDEGSREQLKASIKRLIASGTRVILATHRHENILPEFSHMLCLKDGRVYCKGRRENILTPRNMRRVFGEIRMASPSPRKSTVPASPPEAAMVIDVRHASVRYGHTHVFNDLTWQVRRGENWAVIGPNGSGKTTLLQLIIADHPQAYANEIYLFGRRRGSGESIWEIKRHIGMVSSEFQINYRKPIQAQEVILSGFFNSVGLYRRASREQQQAAQTWIRRLKLTRLKERRYDLLSYGERRMVLLARAMVTSPAILVLDEPCQGLDPASRHRILELTDAVCSRRRTQLLYVTHHPHEMPRCIDHVLDLTSLSS